MIPGDSRAQGNFVKSFGHAKTDWRQLQRGDLMFCMSSIGGQASDYSGVDKSVESITHTGIYLGDGKILHIYSTESGGVKIDTIAGTAWEYRFLFGGSALN